MRLRDCRLTLAMLIRKPRQNSASPMPLEITWGGSRSLDKRGCESSSSEALFECYRSDATYGEQQVSPNIMAQPPFPQHRALAAQPQQVLVQALR